VPVTTARRSGDLANAVFVPLPGTQHEAAALGAILPQATVGTIHISGQHGKREESRM
jgi:hypothetical protein